MTIRDPSVNWYASMFDILDLEKDLLFCCWAPLYSVVLSITSQVQILFVPFSTRFVYEFFFLWSCYSVLWYWPLIILRYLRCIKKARSWHIFFSPFIILLCIVVFNWRSILSHLLTKLIAEVIEWNNCFIRKKGADWLFKCMYTTKKQHILI